MKIEEGRYYRTSDGRKVGPIIDRWNGWLTFETAIGFYRPDGTPYNSKDPTLIAEWTDIPEVGTLAEIGAQVGDVVERSTVMNSRCIVSQYGLDNFTAPDYRIISRANPGPVITETITRKTNKPGVYGILRVEGNDDYVMIGLSSDDDVFLVEVTAPELRAAISTLSQIADAMEDGK